jgi:hypothetical protein
VNNRFWHEADLPVVSLNVRFLEQSGHGLRDAVRLLLTQSGHERVAFAAMHGP